MMALMIVVMVVMVMVMMMMMMMMKMKKKNVANFVTLRSLLQLFAAVAFVD